VLLLWSSRREVFLRLTAGERLAVAREQPPHGLLAMPVEIAVEADVAGDGTADGLVVFRPVVMLL